MKSVLIPYLFRIDKEGGAGNHNHGNLPGAICLGQEIEAGGESTEAPKDHGGEGSMDGWNPVGVWLRRKMLITVESAQK